MLSHTGWQGGSTGSILRTAITTVLVPVGLALAFAAALGVAAKNTNCERSGTSVDAAEPTFSITKWEGVAHDVVPGIQPLWCSIEVRVRVGEMARFEVSDRSLIWNVVCALIASKFLGFWNFEEGMFVEGASTPNVTHRGSIILNIISRVTRGYEPRD
jgi:hypothetical protein